MRDFIPVIIVMFLASGGVAIAATLVFARLDGAPPVINIRQRLKSFMNEPFSEKFRLAQLTLWAFFFGSFACVGLILLFPDFFGSPIVVAIVLPTTIAMAKITIFGSTGTG